MKPFYRIFLIGIIFFSYSLMKAQTICDPLALQLPEYYSWKVKHNTIEENHFSHYTAYAVSDKLSSTKSFPILDFSVYTMPLESAYTTPEEFVENIYTMILQYDKNTILTLVKKEEKATTKNYLYTLSGEKTTLLLFYKTTNTCFYSAEIEIPNLILEKISIEKWKEVFF